MKITRGGLATVSMLQYASLAILAFVLYAVYRTIYELYFSPLAKFPGPKLAAVTRAYELYYDIYLPGQYTFKIKELHAQYGPIIRISPIELHVSDPEFFEVLYAGASGGARNKWQDYTRQFGTDESGFSTVDHRHHRLRRAALNPFFSKQRTNSLQGLIWSLAEKLCARFEEHRKDGSPVPLRFAYNSLTTQAITTYSFDQPWELLDAKDYNPQYCLAVAHITNIGRYMRHVPWMFPILRAIPLSIMKKLDKSMGDLTEAIFRPIDAAVMTILNEKSDLQTNTLENGPPTVFHQLLTSCLPPSEKTFSRLSNEAQVLIGAGADTTGNALKVTTFHILFQPRVLAKLRAELATVMPDANSQPRLQQLEELPYFTAVIHEGLRFSYGLSTRAQRIAPNEVLRYGEWAIPAGTPVGMTSVICHHDESVFPDSYNFLPERWIEAAEAGRPLDRYLMTFGRGTRVCLGMQLAKAELYIVLAAVLRRFDLELYQTSRRDVDVARDLFLPQPVAESKGVRVLVR